MLLVVLCCVCCTVCWVVGFGVLDFGVGGVSASKFLWWDTCGSCLLLILVTWLPIA